MRFIDKIRKLTDDAKSIERAYPLVAKTIEKSALQGSHGCYMQLTPEQIEALRAEGFQVSEASLLFEHYIEW